MQKRVPTIEDCSNVAELFSIDLNFDDLFDELNLLADFIKNPETDKSVGSVEFWNTFFNTVDIIIPNLYKLMSYILAIPSSNTFCESIFSNMFYAWSDSRNCASVDLIKSELCIKNNFNSTCQDFYNFISLKPEILGKVQSKEKYEK